MTEQERLDKAINGLEQFIADFKPFCGNKADWQRVYDAIDLLKAQEPADYIPIDWLMNYAQLPTEFAISAWRKPKKEAEIKQAKSLDKPMSLDDALELLKAQEPRVMTLEYLQRAQENEAPVWLESHGTWHGRKGFWIFVYEITPEKKVMRYNAAHMCECGWLGLGAYNKTWRCWTCRPSQKQMEETPWE